MSVTVQMLKITKGNGWYKDKVGEEFEILRTESFGYVVWEDDENPNDNYDLVDADHCEVFQRQDPCRIEINKLSGKPCDSCGSHGDVDEISATDTGPCLDLCETCRKKLKRMI